MKRMFSKSAVVLAGLFMVAGCQEREREGFEGVEERREGVEAPGIGGAGLGEERELGEREHEGLIREEERRLGEEREGGLIEEPRERGVVED